MLISWPLTDRSTIEWHMPCTLSLSSQSETPDHSGGKIDAWILNCSPHSHFFKCITNQYFIHENIKHYIITKTFCRTLKFILKRGVSSCLCLNTALQLMYFLRPVRAASFSNRNNLPGPSADKAWTPRNCINWEQALWADRGALVLHLLPQGMTFTVISRSLDRKGGASKWNTEINYFDTFSIFPS